MCVCHMSHSYIAIMLCAPPFNVKLMSLAMDLNAQPVIYLEGGEPGDSPLTGYCPPP